jgi:hypothetical protein
MSNTAGTKRPSDADHQQSAKKQKVHNNKFGEHQKWKAGEWKKTPNKNPKEDKTETRFPHGMLLIYYEYTTIYS